MALSAKQAEPCWGIVALLHSSQGIQNPREALGRLKGSRRHTTLRSQSNGMFRADEVRMDSYLSSFSQSASTCLLPQSQELSGPEEPCVEPQQTVGSRFLSLESGPQAGEGNPPGSTEILHHWGFQLLWRPRKVHRTGVSHQDEGKPGILSVLPGETICPSLEADDEGDSANNTHFCPF